jgi:hypothetical protein
VAPGANGGIVYVGEETSEVVLRQLKPECFLYLENCGIVPNQIKIRNNLSLAVIIKKEPPWCSFDCLTGRPLR